MVVETICMPTRERLLHFEILKFIIYGLYYLGAGAFHRKTMCARGKAFNIDDFQVETAIA